MKHIKNIKSQLSLITSAIALSGLSAITLTTSVMAEEAKLNEEIEKIMVTGTRRNDRTVAESTSPVYVVNIDSMSATVN